MLNLVLVLVVDLRFLEDFGTLSCVSWNPSVGDASLQVKARATVC